MNQATVSIHLVDMSVKIGGVDVTLVVTVLHIVNTGGVCVVVVVYGFQTVELTIGAGAQEGLIMTRVVVVVTGTVIVAGVVVTTIVSVMVSVVVAQRVTVVSVIVGIGATL